MNRSYAGFSVLSLFLAACGAENSLVGGECAAGYTFVNGGCVRTAAASATPAPTIAPYAAEVPSQTAVSPGSTSGGTTTLPRKDPPSTTDPGQSSSSGGTGSSSSGGSSSGGSSSGGTTSSSGGASSGSSSGSSSGASSGGATSSSGSTSSSSGGATSSSGTVGSSSGSVSSSSGSTSSSSGGATSSSGGGSSSGGSSSGGSSSGGVVVVVPPDPPATTCSSGLTSCRESCVPLNEDGQNCGACGRICPSNYCVAGECQGVTPGDIVVIGHDMSQAPGYSTHAKVFTNAVHLPQTNPLRVLAFEDDARTDIVDATRSLTASALGNRSLLLAHGAASAFEDPDLYSKWDVVLVDGIATANASSYGNRWATALSSFTKKGGVLVALDSGEGDLPGFFASSQLMALGTHVPFGYQTSFIVSAPSDTVGSQLLSPYAAFGQSVGFSGTAASSSDFVWVVRTETATSLPTVIHKIAR